MAFNLYFAGAYSPRVEKKLMEMGVNRLASQLNDRNLIYRWIDFMKENEHRKLFIDSGAYSAHTRGKELDVDEYIEYLNERQGFFEVIAQVDKIPGEFGKPKTHEQLLEAPDTSWENYLYMRERVKDVDNLTPIFHQGEDFKHLHRVLETTFDGKHIPYIGISPANDVSTRYKSKWFENVFKIIRDSSNPNVKTHAFGMTSLKLLESYPFYSADSTSWKMISSTGCIMTSKGTIPMSDLKKNDPNHYIYLPKSVQESIKEELGRWGISIEQAMESYHFREIVNVSYLMDWAKNYKFKGTERYQRRLF